MAATPPRLRDLPGRSRPARTLLDDVRDSGEVAGRNIGPEGKVPEDVRDRIVGRSDLRPEALRFSCPTCPATHSAEMMLSVAELSGSGVPDPAETPYICCWCDQHGRRMGRIDRDVP